MTAKRMRLLTAGLAIIALIAALFVINPGLGRSAPQRGTEQPPRALKAVTETAPTRTS